MLPFKKEKKGQNLSRELQETSVKAPGGLMSGLENALHHARGQSFAGIRVALFAQGPK